MSTVLSHVYPFDPVQLTRNWRGLRSWWPSTRVGTDPQQHLLVDGRYAPVSVANWKLIPPVAHGLLAQRVAVPLSFTAGQRLTVVIPYRDRKDHLERLLPVLTARLRDQRVAYRILVVEQEDAGLFNRGKLINIGVREAAAYSDYYCLHDVDAIPLNANYLCPSQPLRLVNRIIGEAAATHRTGHYFSGAVSIRREQIYAANGYSNEYWGWGKEDDDFYFRLLMSGFFCYFDVHGEFEDLPNPRLAHNGRVHMSARRALLLNRQRRSRLLRGLDSPAQDGICSLSYEVTRRVTHPDYQLITVRW